MYKMFVELLGVCGLSVTILHICLLDIFLGLYIFPSQGLFLFRTINVTVETETVNLCDNFLYPSPNSC